nr:PREDICTED: uncharacterized protein LOC108213583 isoform X2 [Daucus carota subsp. sativus]
MKQIPKGKQTAGDRNSVETIAMCSHQFLLWFSDTKPQGMVYYIAALLSHIVHTLYIGRMRFSSLPYLIGCRKNQNCKLYAHSLIGVGVALSLYFKRKIKKTFEMADYATIVAATVCLSRALRDEKPKAFNGSISFGFTHPASKGVSCSHRNDVDIFL